MVSPQPFGFENVDNMDIKAASWGRGGGGGGGIVHESKAHLTSKQYKNRTACEVGIHGTERRHFCLTDTVNTSGQGCAGCGGAAASHQKRGISVDMKNSVLQGVVSSRSDHAVSAQVGAKGRRGITIWGGGKEG
jgi:hypothetical protein